MLSAYDSAQKGFDRVKSGPPYKPFVGTDEYKSVRNFLNIHELIAVGIHKNVFDEKVCYSFWCDEMISDWNAAKGMVDYIRQLPGEGTRYSYIEVEKLARSWSEKKARDDRRPIHHRWW